MRSKKDLSRTDRGGWLPSRLWARLRRWLRKRGPISAAINDFFRQLSRSYRDTYRLEKRYYRLTTVIGLIGVLVGSVVLIFAAVRLAGLLGMDPDAPLLGHPNGLLFFGALLIMIVLAYYSSTVVVAALFSSVLVCLRKITLREAIYYSFLSKYPQAWFRSEADAARAGMEEKNRQRRDDRGKKGIQKGEP